MEEKSLNFEIERLLGNTHQCESCGNFFSSEKVEAVCPNPNCNSKSTVIIIVATQNKSR